MSTRLAIGMPSMVGSAESIDLAFGHPTSHPGFALDVDDADGLITGVSLRPGFMHRGAEKLFESRDYRQVMMLANRHDWLSSFHSELLIALTLEEAMGIAVPERATWTRMLLAEANRIACTMAFLAPVLSERASPDAWAIRERLVTLQESLTGSRMHPMYARIGGVASGLTTKDLDEVREALEYVDTLWASLATAVDELTESVAGLAVLSHDDALSYGATGPVGAASGLDADLRTAAPYLFYAQFRELIDSARNPAATGDAAARYRSLARQVAPSIAITRECLAPLSEMIDQPFDVILPKSVRAPEGTTLGTIDGPLGMMGCLLVSTGDRMPWRLRLRTPSFAHAQAMQVALIGTPRERLSDAVMSFLLVVGDIDR